MFSPEWWDELVFSSQEARRLGLSFETNASNGYVAGGRWITPDKGMQRLNLSTIQVEGGKDVRVRLPLPGKLPYGWHRDVLVLAVPYDKELMAEHTMTEEQVLDLGQPMTMRSITYEATAQGRTRTRAMQVPPSHFGLKERPGKFFGCGYEELPMLGDLEASSDGRAWHKVCGLRPHYRGLFDVKQHTVAFPAIHARYFRIRRKHSEEVSISNIVLSACAMVDNWQNKAALVSEYIDAGDSTGNEGAIDFSRAIDLSSRLQTDGTLSWPQAPRGQWLIMRFFAQSTGGRTKHGRKEALGLECDKLSRKGAHLQWQSYVKPIIDTLKAHGGILTGVCMDSHEAGSQNWTANMEREFLRLRGYDMRRFLPVMAGYIVQSGEASDRFLYDLRRTISDLITTEYYGEFNKLCRAEGLTLTAQAIGALTMPGDGIEVKKLIDKPQTEFWGYQTEGNYDIKDGSSACHVYGKQIVSGEAYTDVTYRHSLADIKNLADYAYAFGINEMVVCAVAYQPWVGSPLRLNTANGRQYVLNRMNTLWPMSQPFWDYQARCSWMMRQGKPVADYCIYLGDDVPNRIISHRLPNLPEGSDFDAFTTDALLTRMTCRNGRIELPDGINYRMMILPHSGQLTEAAKQKITQLRQEGACIYNPQTDPRTLRQAISEAGIVADVDAPKANGLYFAHRKTEHEHIYFLNNHSDEAVSERFVLNAQAAQAELWNPVTGEKYKLDARQEQGRTAIDLQMAPRESFFIVLSDRESRLPIYIPFRAPRKVQPITGTWMVTFDHRMGGPALPVAFEQLTDLSKNDDPRIRYYAGTATYKNTCKLKAKDEHCSYRLAFGQLAGAAEVVVNGKKVGTVWCSPYYIDITPYIKKGKNEIELRVATCLWNRLAGDATVAENERIYWQNYPLAKPADRLIPAGIIGSVNIIEQQR